MRVELTPDQEAFVRQAIKDGRVGSTEDAVQEALQLWEKRERRRGEIIAAVTEAEAALDRGEGRRMTEDSLKYLAKNAKRRVLTHLDSVR
jgi:putative addiction module CopG family antidote